MHLTAINNTGQRIKTFSQQGAYNELISYIETLDIDQQSQPETVLEKYRAYLRQGQAKLAEQTLQNAHIEHWSPAMQLLHAMESASISVYRYLHLQPAMDTGKHILQQCRQQNIPVADTAETERVYLRHCHTTGIG
jgi:hypothetical protein